MSIARTSSLVALAFVAGLATARLSPVAFAQTPSPAPLTAQIIDIDALDGDAIGPLLPSTELRTRTLVATANATVGVQQGNIGKHFHATADEIQFILAGSGTMWLGDTRRQIKAGDLIIVPKGTHHAGTVPASGTFKALVIKIPPQATGDTQFVQ